MRFLLPILTAIILFAGVFNLLPPKALAQTQGINVGQAGPLDNKWIIDPEVTSIGKNASRSGLLLDWALRDYDWSYVVPGSSNPLIPFWVTIRNFAYAFMFSLVIISAIVMVVTRGRSLTIRRFLPRFILIAVLVTFSFSLIQVIYEVIDIFQGFFVRPGGVPISQRDLLFISWNYDLFTGLRLLGDQNYEAAFSALTLVKLTTFTYYVMVGILLVRKIILWFFIIISPVFPLLLMFYPLRNTAKIWIGEFFRWLLYGPLFAIFLAGLVSLWKIGIPLQFNFGSVNTTSGIVFPTAVSILLGGPGQTVTQLNNINIIDTYAQYVVALLMLWGVIIIPWILLQIFLDYFSNMNFENNQVAKQLARYVNKLPISSRNGSPPPPPAPSDAGTGLARNLPIFKDFKIPYVTSAKPAFSSTAVSIPEVTKITIPTMRDIARYDIDRISHQERVSTEASHVTTTLRNISNPNLATLQKDREDFENRRNTLRSESIKGNQVATNLLNIAQKYSTTVEDNRVTNINNVVNELANPQTITDSIEREKFNTLRERLTVEESKGNLLAKTVLGKISQTDRSSTLTKVLKELSSQNVSKSLSSTKELLEQKKSSGNPLATKIVSEIEKLKQFEKVREDLVSVYNPQKASETVKESSQKLHESVISEIAKGNAFAQAVSTQLERLSKEDSLVKQQEIVSEIKEQAIKEDKNGNVLAQGLLHAIQGLAGLGSLSDLTLLQKELDDARRQGNPLAAQLLDASGRKDLTEEEAEKIEQDINDAKGKGDPLAVLLSDLITRNSTSPIQEKAPETLPETNRIQKVSLDDYESVKKMWTESYQNLDAPGTDTEEGRANWIKDDIRQISETIDLLASTDSEKIKEGMDRVSEILPFLLVGGFSQDEVTAYMKAKLEAAKGVLSEIEKKNQSEDTKIEVKHTSSSSPKTLYTAVSNTREETVDNFHEAPSVSPVSTPEKSTPRGLTLLNSLSIKLPGLSDLAHYDSMLSSGARSGTELSSIEEKMRGIKNPPSMPSSQRNYFAYLRNTALRESEEGNPVAKALLSASEYGADHPEKTSHLSLPDKNELQSISLEDYEAIKRQWEEYYEKLEVPPGRLGPRSRTEWIKDDILEISKTIDLLMSKDSSNISEGMSRLSDLLPFILLGGFTNTELVSYLKAKLEASRSTLKSLEQKEDEKLPRQTGLQDKKNVLKQEQKNT